MKNDIDSILDSMFKGGKLNFGKGTPGKPGPLNEAAQNTMEAGKALEGAQQAGDNLSRSLQSSIEQLTKEAQADMEALNLRLENDGLKSEKAPAANAVGPENLDEAFEKARGETEEAVLGQERFVASLAIAYKRPFVAGYPKDLPMSRIIVMGRQGTGRHSALRTLTASLGRQGVLKSGKLAEIDLSRYAAADSEKLFAQDFYAAVKSGAAALVFEQFEKCHTSVLSMVSALFLTGSMPLSGRYAEQKGMLVDIGTALVPGAVSSLTAAGKYVILLTESGEKKLTDAFGAPFLTAAEDLCSTEAFTPEALRRIAERELQSLGSRMEKKLGFRLRFGGEEVKALADKYSPDSGVEGMSRYAERVYRLLGEYKLTSGLKTAEAVLTEEGGEFSVKIVSGATTVFQPVAEQSGAAESAVEEIKRELSEIVGLGTVKEYILSLEDNFKVQQMRRERGMKADFPSMHMIFTGNPGTGKTTVARIVSRYLKAIGVLSGGQLVEATRADLVGRYVGHTAPLTQKAIESALGGVLFIDEAYALFRGSDDSFGLEAIDTLVKGMEDNRENLVVILAGYSREMEEFLTANSGLKSRFPNIIEFPDYTAEELLAITKSIVKGKGYRLDSDCDGPLTAYYDIMQQTGDPRTNGNGRMARNKVEEAVLNCSRRNVKMPPEEQDLELLKPEDFRLDVSAQ